MPSPYGFNYGSSSAKKPAPRRQSTVRTVRPTAGQYIERGMPERIPGGGMEGLMMEWASAGAHAPATALERPLAGINVASRAFSNWADFSNKQRSAAEAKAPVGPAPKGPVDEVLRRIGQVGIPNPFKMAEDQKFLSIEGIINGAGVAYQRGATVVSSVLNSGDARAVQWIAENNYGPDQVIPNFLRQGINPIANMFHLVGSATGEEKPLTVRDYLTSLNNRGFFDDYENLDPNTGLPTKLSPKQVGDNMKEQGWMGAFQFGDKMVDENVFVDLMGKMATDPTLYLMGAGVPVKIAGWGKARLLGQAATATSPATLGVGRWALPRMYSMATGRGFRPGVGYMADMERMGVRAVAGKVRSTSQAAANWVNGNAAGTTLRGMGWGLKQLYLPGRGSVGLRYARGSTIQQFGLMGTSALTGTLDDYEIGDGLFGAINGLSESILNDHPLAGNQLFVLMAAFNYPVGGLGKGVWGSKYDKVDPTNPTAPVAPGSGVRGAMQRIAGENNTKPWTRDREFMDAVGGPQKGLLRTKGPREGATYNLREVQHRAEEAVYKAFEGGKEGFDVFTDYMNLHMAWNRLMDRESFAIHAKSLDHTIGEAGPMFDIVREHTNELLRSGEIKPSMHKAELNRWVQENIENFIDGDGNIAFLKHEGGYDVPVARQVERWNEYMRANREIAERVGPLKDATVGRGQTMTQSGIDQFLDAFDDLVVDGAISSTFVRSTLDKYPAMFVDGAIPASTREFFAGIMNPGRASGLGVLGKGKGKLDAAAIREQLLIVKKVVPKGEDLWHEGTAAEASIIDDLARNEESSVMGPRGVSTLYSQKQLREHRLRSVANGRELSADVARLNKVVDAKWTKRGNLKQSWVKAEEARLRERLTQLEAGKSRLTKNNSVEHVRVQEELEQLLAMSKGIEWTGAKGGPIVTKTFNELYEIDRLALVEKKGQLNALREDQLAFESMVEELGGINLHYTFIGRDGSVSIPRSEVSLVQAQAKYTQDKWGGQLEIKRTPAGSLSWNVGDSAIGAIHSQRTSLGRIVFDYGPVSSIANLLNHFTEKVSSSARVAEGRAMMYNKLMKMGATEGDVTKFIADLIRRRDEAGDMGPMQIKIARYETALNSSQIQQSGLSIWGADKGSVNAARVMEALQSEYRGSFANLIDRASNSLVRKGEMAVLKGAGDLSPRAIQKAFDEGTNLDLSGGDLLARIFASGYHAYQNVPALAGTTRFIDKNFYAMFRFYASPRWQLMNMLENDALGIFQDGFKASRWNKKAASTDLARNAYDQAEAGFQGRRVDPRLTGDARPGRETIHNLPETGVISGRWMEDVMRNQFQLRSAQDIHKFIDDLPNHSPYVKWMEEHFGKEKETWSQQIENMLYHWDKDGVVATAQAEFKRVGAGWSPAEQTEFMPFLNRIAEKHQQTYSDIAAIQLGNVSRSRLERTLNSYWLYWPISYQIKTTKWMVDLLSNRMFGNHTNLGGAYMLDHAAEIFAENMRNNPSFRQQIEEHDTLWMAFSMLLPAVPWNQGVSLSRLPRYFGGNVLGLWPEYAGFDSPADYARKAMEMGPLYDSEITDRLWGEMGWDEDTESSGDFEPPVRTR